MTGMDTSRRLVVLMAAMVLGTVLAAGCGGGGSPGGDPEDSPEDLYVVTFSVPDFSGIFLNEQVSFTFSEKVKRSSLNFDSIQLRTGPNGGVAPRGTFVRGTFTRGRVDTARKNVVTFLPAVPNKVDLSDTGYAPNSTYTVIVPSWPNLNTVKNRGNEPMVQVFTSRFTTLPPNSPQLFLDSDFPGSPDVIGISPSNGADDVAEETSVRITFSEPLNPGTVLPVDPDNPNIVLQNISSSPPLIVPVSYFLAQTRDSVTVTLNPLTTLEASRVYQVVVKSFVTDLVGNPITPFVASFSTGGQPPAPGNFIEDFSTNIQEDALLTTANWNNRLSTFVGGSAGKLSAVFAPFAGDGADGALTLTPGKSLTLDTGTTTQRIYRYTSIDIQNGATLYGTGNYALVLQSQGDVDIAGTVVLNGTAGGLGSTGTGESNETIDLPGDATGGSGGAGAAGGFAGGDGGNAVTGSAGFLDGIDGSGTGGGNGGHGGDLQATDSDPNTQFALRSREGGGGGAHGTDGGDATTAQTTGKGGGTGGLGGESYGEDDFSDSTFKDGVAILGLGFGGSGGAGGGSEDDSGRYVNDLPPTTGPGDGLAANDDEGGGGGGGGGGALHVLAYGDVSFSGMIVCNGGRGGDTEDLFGNIGQGDAGGGGAGGAVWFQVFGEMTVAEGAVMTCTGGVGGNFATLRVGGSGGAGYIRFEDASGTIDGLPSSDLVPTPTTGVFSPSLSLTSAGYARWFNTQRASPRYGFPTEFFSLNGGSVAVEYQATNEDVNTPGPNPDLDPDVLTGWVSGALIDTISNRQWIRFRVLFAVPDDHPFNTAFPEVDLINVPITF